MKVGNFNANDYLDRLHEEAEQTEGNTDKGYILATDKDGLILPEDTKKNFDWLNKEYQKGKVEVKVEVSGTGSSFKPGYDLQTDLKSVKDFKPGMYGDVKTGDTAKGIDKPLTRGEEPKSPTNQKEETDAEDTDPKDANESTDKKEQSKPATTTAKSQNMEVTVKNKKNDK